MSLTGSRILQSHLCVRDRHIDRMHNVSGEDYRCSQAEDPLLHQQREPWQVQNRPTRNELCSSPYFPHRLAALRKERNLTQQARAEMVGMGITQIKRYEAGTSQPTLDAIRKLATTLRVSADELLFGKTERDQIRTVAFSSKRSEASAPKRERLRVRAAR